MSGPLPVRFDAEEREPFCVHEIGGVVVGWPRSECPNHMDLAADDYSHAQTNLWVALAALSATGLFSAALFLLLVWRAVR